MKINNFIPLLLAGLELMTACTDSSSSFDASEVCPESGRGTFQDVRDGQVYKYITIGDRVWMDQNLNYPAETSTCYDEQQSNCDIYGRLYSVQYMNTKQKTMGRLIQILLIPFAPMDGAFPPWLNGMKSLIKWMVSNISKIANVWTFLYLAEWLMLKKTQVQVSP